MKNSTKKINNSGFLDHLVELRSRLLYIIGVIIVCLLALMPFANDIYTILAKPLFDVMPENSTMIAVDVAAPFLAPFLNVRAALRTVRAHISRSQQPSPRPRPFAWEVDPDSVRAPL